MNLEFYFFICLLVFFILCIMTVLIKENNRFGADVKKKFYTTYIIIGLSAFAEFASVIMNGMPMWTKHIHLIVKAVDYIVTPMSGIFLVMQVSKDNIYKKLPWALIIINAVVEVISIFTGWIFYIDDTNTYRHGEFYFIYMAVYIIELIIVVREFWKYGKTFEKNNRLSLLSIVFFVCLSIIIQEMTGTTIRTTTFGITIGSVLLFIHFSEFGQLKNDMTIEYQKNLLRTDPLTGMENRYAYVEELDKYKDKDKVSSNLIVFSIDANGLKTVNDEYGHLEGDKLIIGVAECVKKVFEAYGKCFRTGGDEFIVIVDSFRLSADILQKRLKEEVNRYNTNSEWRVSLSSGWASFKENDGISIEELINIADKKMYEDKELFYSISGNDRRKVRR